MTPEEIAAEFHRRRVIVMQVECAQSVYAEHANRVQRGMDKIAGVALGMAKQGVPHYIIGEGLVRYAEERGIGDGSGVPEYVKRGDLVRTSQPNENLGQRDITAIE